MNIKLHLCWNRKVDLFTKVSSNDSFLCSKWQTFCQNDIMCFNILKLLTFTPFYITIHYTDVIMTTVASLITSLTVVYSTLYSDADQRKDQSSASLAFVWGIHRDRWIPRTKGQLRGKCFHLMTSSWHWHYMSVKTSQMTGSWIGFLSGAFSAWQERKYQSAAPLDVCKGNLPDMVYCHSYQVNFITVAS